MGDTGVVLKSRKIILIIDDDPDLSESSDTETDSIVKKAPRRHYFLPEDAQVSGLVLQDLDMEDGTFRWRRFQPNSATITFGDFPTSPQSDAEAGIPLSGM